jgi:hypothetical protein
VQDGDPAQRQAQLDRGAQLQGRQHLVFTAWRLGGAAKARAARRPG